MAADTTQLQGEIMEDPASREVDVEAFLVGFLRALIEEQGLGVGAAAAVAPAAAAAPGSAE